MFTEEALASHQGTIRGHCYRMLGSGPDADDATQETMIRAWKARESFAGRSRLSTWLYRIATRVCLDALANVQRRVIPVDDYSARAGDIVSMQQHPSEHWVAPVADARLADNDPRESLSLQESVRFAFVVALQKLSARERAHLLLRDVLGFSASEAASCLNTSVAAANSALQRARASLGETSTASAASEQHDAWVHQYMEAFAAYDIDKLVLLLREDVRFDMPPYALWLQGRAAIRAWMTEHDECRGSKLVATRANGVLAFAQYRRQSTGGYSAWAVVAMEADDSGIYQVHNFLDAESLFPHFGLPLSLPID